MAAIVPELQIGAKLGNGHFGEVFLGTDGVHGNVAVKVLSRKPEHSDAEWQEYKVGFLAEAQHLSKATHQNVVRVHHIEELPDGNSIRFCMEYCSGGSLQSKFEAGPMTLAAVRKAATEMLMGLSALHSRGMLHRDIKPGNVLLTNRGLAKLGDFGLVTDNVVLGYASQAGYNDHLAYEVYHGQGTSVKTDIWALGMTLYRLLHGAAWYGDTPIPREIIADGGFAHTLRWLPHLPKGWRRVIRRMLNDDPSARFQSANEALGALSNLQITPIWEVDVGSDYVSWLERSSTRLKKVEWVTHSPRKHEWSAWSEPVGSGRKKALAGSNGIVGKQHAISGLENYFAA